jgi:tellurite resistance protein TerB
MLGFGKKFRKAKAEAVKIENRDLMQAIVAGSLLVASISGGIEKKETDVIETMLRAMPSMSHFGSEITETITRFTNMLRAGATSARIQILRELDDIKASQEEKELCLCCIIDVCKADGEFDDQEKAELAKIAERLGLRLDEYI